MEFFNQFQIFKSKDMSKELKFKTSINCSNCVRSVTGFLDDVKGIDKWNVDTDHPEKILTVEGVDILQKSAVIEAVEDAGFDIQIIGD